MKFFWMILLGISLLACSTEAPTTNQNQSNNQTPALTKASTEEAQSAQLFPIIMRFIATQLIQDGFNTNGEAQITMLNSRVCTSNANDPFGSIQFNSKVNANETNNGNQLTNESFVQMHLCSFLLFLPNCNFQPSINGDMDCEFSGLLTSDNANGNLTCKTKFPCQGLTIQFNKKEMELGLSLNVPINQAININDQKQLELLLLSNPLQGKICFNNKEYDIANIIDLSQINTAELICN